MAWFVVALGVSALLVGFWGARALGRARALAEHRAWSVAGHRVTARAVARGWYLETAVEGAGFTLASRRQGDVATLQGPGATRDPIFDRRFQVDGPLEARTLLLDRRLRASLVALADLGAVVLTERQLLVASAEVSEALAQLVADTAMQLRSDGLTVRLRDAASLDPSAEIREAALRALDALVGGDAHWAVATRDPSPEIRLRAATRLGPEGEATLWKLAEDTTLDRTLRRRAAELLVGPGSPGSFSVRALGVVLPHPSLAATVARRLPMGRMPSGALQTLVRAVSSDDEAVRTSAVLLLARHPAPEVESELIPLLNDPSPSVQQAVVAALGAVGSVPSVHALHRLAADRDLDPRLQVEIARSIARCDPRGVVRR